MRTLHRCKITETSENSERTESSELSIFSESSESCIMSGTILEARVMTMQIVFSWWLIVTLATVGAYDIYAVIFLPPNSTVSFALWDLGKRFPSFYLFVG